MSSKTPQNQFNRVDYFRFPDVCLSSRGSPARIFHIQPTAPAVEADHVPYRSMLTVASCC